MGNSLKTSSYHKPEHNEEGDSSSDQTFMPYPKKFRLSELKRATGNFNPNAMLWEGATYGEKVYIGWVNGVTYKPSKTAGVGSVSVAVKKFGANGLLDFSEWQEEVNFLGNLSHANLVNVVGYCKKDEQYLLVYEYMQMDSLENRLFRSAGEPLPWSTRIKIAIGAAQGLAYLHAMKQDAIYSEFKSSSILLDEDSNAKLSYFGFAKKLPSCYHHDAVCFDGYEPPEYAIAGIMNVKSEIYRFGVMLLELITGLRAFDYDRRPKKQRHLLSWARPALQGNRELLMSIIDPQLQGPGPNAYPIEAAVKKVARVILSCTTETFEKRPPMEQVVAKLQDIGAI